MALYGFFCAMMTLSTPAKLAQTDWNLDEKIADKIPYAYFFDQQTIETKSGHLLQVIKFDGLMAETMDDLAIDQEKNLRNSLLRSITDSSISLYFHTIRKKDYRQLSGEYQQDFAKQLNEKWQENIAKKQFFINEHYITIVKKPPVNKIRRAADLFAALSSKVNHQARAVYRKKNLKDLNKITQRILGHLNHYVVTQLEATKLLAFLAELINLEQRDLALPQMDLANFLPYKRYFFDKTAGLIALRNVNNSVDYAAILSIREYDKETIAGMLDHLLNIKAEIIITQSFAFLDKTDAKKKISEQQRNQFQSDDSSVSETDKIDHAIDDLASSSASMGDHHFTVLCKANSVEALEKSIATIDAALNEIGIIAIREDVGILPAFFAMLPANHAYIVRRAMISSKNMACFASCHNYSSGSFQNNYWGEAVTTLETISGTPFFFNFHVLDVANTFLIGPMGSGKTLLEAFLLAQSMKFGGRLLVLDKDRGLEIFIRAMHGSYNTLSAGQRTGFAPFQLTDNADNRYFLANLLRKMATAQGQTITDEELTRIKAAVDGAFNLPREQRILRNIVAFLGMRKSGSLRARFDHWVMNGDYAWVFDNEIDELSLKNPIMGFDMSSILSEPIISAPIYAYLFHRIEQLLDGSKTRIVVAEGWRALQDDTFCRQIQEWSSTPRKKEAFLVMDTQSPEDIVQSPIACKMIQETVTQIYFANPSANHAHYVGKFGLSEKEFQIIKNLDKNSRFFLLKQGKNSVVVRADLSSLQTDIAVLSGRTAYIKILDKLRAEHGDDPNVWLPHYLLAVNKNLAVIK